MGHDFDLNKQSLQKIDKLLPRLNYSVLPSKIIKWLENFEEKDIENAIDLLRIFEYISYDEILYRFNDLLEKLLTQIPDGEKILIMPYGKLGKSGTFITYPLMKTTAYQSRESDIKVSVNYEEESGKNYSHIVFIDDFIGSGNTFLEEYREKKIEDWVLNEKIDNKYILAPIMMWNGQKNIEYNFPDFTICADIRVELFHNYISPLDAFNNYDSIHSFASEYGAKLLKKSPLGYGNGQALVAYFHSTPNNTLPIIWHNKKWQPLYPRFPSTRMELMREFKKDIAFMIGICNRLGIDLYKDEVITIKENGKKKRIIKYNTKIHHSIVALLRLKTEGYDDMIISHILGLTMKELDEIYSESFSLGFMNSNRQLNITAELFLKELYQKTNSERFKKETDENLKLKNELYLPDNFKGH